MSILPFVISFGVLQLRWFWELFAIRRVIRIWTNFLIWFLQLALDHVAVESYWRSSPNNTSVTCGKIAIIVTTVQRLGVHNGVQQVKVAFRVMRLKVYIWDSAYRYRVLLTPVLSFFEGSANTIKEKLHRIVIRIFFLFWNFINNISKYSTFKNSPEVKQKQNDKWNDIHCYKVHPINVHGYVQRISS